MTVQELKDELEAFLNALEEHHTLWAKSLNNIMPTHPTTNKERLQEQSRALSRQLGRIRPYILLFDRHWTMRQGATGVTWDALSAAVSAGQVALIKGASIRTVTDKINQIIGALEARNPHQQLMAHGGMAVSNAPKSDAPPIEVPPPPGAAPAPKVDAPSSDSPRSAAPDNREPFTLEKMSVRELLRAIGNLSLAAALTVIAALIAIISTTIAITRSADSRQLNAVRDSIVVQQQLRDSITHADETIRALRRQLDSLTTRTRRGSP